MNEIRLMTSHGEVFFYLAARPNVTISVIAQDLELSERRVCSVLSDLAGEGLLRVVRAGRCNSYRADLERGLAERLYPKGSAFGKDHARLLRELLEQSLPRQSGSSPEPER